MLRGCVWPQSRRHWSDELAGGNSGQNDTILLLGAHTEPSDESRPHPGGATCDASWTCPFALLLSSCQSPTTRRGAPNRFLLAKQSSDAFLIDSSNRSRANQLVALEILKARRWTVSSTSSSSHSNNSSTLVGSFSQRFTPVSTSLSVACSHNLVLHTPFTFVDGSLRLPSTLV
jgi:hypothetical protein